MAHRQVIVLSAVTVLTPVAASAADDNLRLIDSAAAAPTSIEKVLDNYTEHEGYSFVYDSRVLAGKTLSAESLSAKSYRSLKNYLLDAGLDLHKTGPRSYAIAPAIAAAASAPKAPSVAGYVDIVLVSASLPAGLGEAPLASGHLFEIDEKQLTYASGRSAAEILHDLPLDNSNITPSSTVLFGALAGVNYLDFRGFGTNRNAVLLNGRPATGTIGGNGLSLGVDLGEFPTELLSRIEVDSDSASARYTPSAFAGAVNFVLRSSYQGVEAGAEIGVSQRGDDLNETVHFLSGREVLGGAGEVTVGLSIKNRNGVLGKQREFAQTRYGLKGDGQGGYNFLPGYGDSPITQTGFIPGVIIDDTFTPLPGGELLIPSSDGGVTPYGGAPSQRYNALEDLHISPTVEQAFGFVSFSGEFGAGVEIIAEAYGGLIATGNQLGPVPATHFAGLTDLQIGDALVIPVTNPNVPAALIQTLTDIYGEAPDSIVLDKRIMEAGPRRDDLNRYYSDVHIGLKKGDMPHGYVSLGYSFGRTHLDYFQRDRMDAGKLQLSLDPDACLSVPGCTLANPFDPSGLSAPVIAFANLPVQISNLNLQEHVISIGAGRAIGGILPSEVLARANLEYKNSALASSAISPAGAHPIGVFIPYEQSARLETFDASASLELPLLRWTKGIGEVDVALDYRITASSAFDTVSNFEVSAEWRPNDIMRFYFRHSDGHRPPNIVELYSKEPAWGVAVVDPCAGGFASASSNLIENCLSDARLGVGADFESDNRLVASASFGNPDLQAEKTRSFAYGAVATPFEYAPWFPGVLEISATWRSFRADNLIGLGGDGLDACFESAGFSDRFCGVNPLTGTPFIARDPMTKQLVTYDKALSNTGRAQTWRGLDLELRYGIKPSDGRFVDRLWLNAFHTYTQRIEVTADGAEPYRLDGLASYPRHATIVSAGAERGLLGLEVHARRRGSIVTTRADRPGVRAPSATYIGTTLRVQPRDNLMIKLNVENLTDRAPPILFGASTNSNSLPSYYDVIGRRFTLSTVMRF